MKQSKNMISILMSALLVITLCGVPATAFAEEEPEGLFAEEVSDIPLDPSLNAPSGDPAETVVEEASSEDGKKVLRAMQAMKCS